VIALRAYCQTYVGEIPPFSGFAESLLAMVYLRYPELESVRRAARPRVLLTSAEGN
jgi:hypothetical protein